MGKKGLIKNKLLMGKVNKMEQIITTIKMIAMANKKIKALSIVYFHFLYYRKVDNPTMKKIIKI